LILFCVGGMFIEYFARKRVANMCNLSD
jgi:hypothetical protein